MQTLIYIATRIFLFFIRLFPYKFRIYFFYPFFLLSYRIPSLRSTALKNMQIVFPDRELAWRESLIKRSAFSLARLLADFTRIPELNREWVDKHVDYSIQQEYLALKAKQPDVGVIFVTGHLGSFELLCQTQAILGYPLVLIVRALQVTSVDRLFNSIRELHGNIMVYKKGGFRQMLKSLLAGKDLGILFDQNVTKKHAVFVDWFGYKAATTRAIALAAMRTNAPIFMIGYETVKFDQYRMYGKILDLDHILNNPELDDEQKVTQITQIVSDYFQTMILRQPEGWFWMHKRWKTRPENETQEQTVKY